MERSSLVFAHATLAKPSFCPPAFLCLCVLACPALVGPSFARGQTATPLVIDADYPGGNITVESINGDTVILRPDLRDTAGWWFYWNFRVRGAQGRTLTFRFSGNNPIGVHGPTVSTDRGRTWSWLGAEVVRKASFEYAFAPNADEVCFCLAIPYQEKNLREFLASYQGHAHLKMQELCKTRKGRRVERLHLGRLDGNPRFRILVTARHHACEMMASHVLEGLLAAILADTGDGAWLRRNVEFLAIPFMDKDGVEDGDQGKNRKPHDHNRDYGGQSLYPSVAALRKLVPAWSGGKLCAVFDLHCPYIRGPHNEVIYIVGKSDESIWREQSRFGRILEDIQHGPLCYLASDNLPFGQGWNTAGTFHQGLPCSQWATSLADIRLVATLEFPYANVHGQAVTAQSARAFGQRLAQAIRRYLEQMDS